jgi:hypothetical protein
LETGKSAIDWWWSLVHCTCPTRRKSCAASPLVTSKFSLCDHLEFRVSSNPTTHGSTAAHGNQHHERFTASQWRQTMTSKAAGTTGSTRTQSLRLSITRLQSLQLTFLLLVAMEAVSESVEVPWYYHDYENTGNNSFWITYLFNR